jgi:hypothetical protein
VYLHRLQRVVFPALSKPNRTMVPVLLKRPKVCRNDRTRFHVYDVRDERYDCISKLCRYSGGFLQKQGGILQIVRKLLFQLIYDDYRRIMIDELE